MARPGPAGALVKKQQTRPVCINVVPMPSVVGCCRSVELNFWAAVTERGSSRKCRSHSNAAQLALAWRGAVWPLQPQPFVLTLGISLSGAQVFMQLCRKMDMSIAGLKTYLPLAHILFFFLPFCWVKINFYQFTGLVQSTGIVSSGAEVAG